METIKEIVKLGAPVALQDLLVSISFLAIHSDCESARRHRFRQGRRSGEGLYVYPAGALGLRSIHFRLCRAEYRRDSAPRGQKRGMAYGIATSLLFRNLYELFRLFPWRFASPGLFARDPQVILAAASLRKLMRSTRCWYRLCSASSRLFQRRARRLVMFRGTRSAPFFVRIPVSYLASKRLQSPCSRSVWRHRVLPCSDHPLCPFIFSGWDGKKKELTPVHS